jgi:hypothetical protein
MFCTAKNVLGPVEQPKSAIRKVVDETNLVASSFSATDLVISSFVTSITPL